MCRKIKYLSLVLLLAGLVSMPFVVLAEENEVGFSVNALLPENQIDSAFSYFNLRVSPEQEQKLEIAVHNHEQEELTVQLAVHNASTNSNGIVVYEETESVDSSLEVPLTDILTFQEDEITIPADESKTVTAALKMPKEEFDGIILGGLHFEKMTEEKEGQVKGVQLENKYAYVIGVQLSENDEAVLPDLVFQSVTPELVNYRTAVAANIQNKAPVLLKDMEIHTKIFDENENLIQEKKQEQINMAPNSNMDVIIDWNNEPLQPGTYKFDLTADHMGETWDWQETFVIEKETAKEINQEAVELDENESNKWLIIGIIILFLVVLALLAYIRKLKKRSDVN